MNNFLYKSSISIRFFYVDDLFKLSRNFIIYYNYDKCIFIFYIYMYFIISLQYAAGTAGQVIINTQDISLFYMFLSAVCD